MNTKNDNDVVSIYKPLGLTPLQAILKYKDENPEYRNIKMTYAGRLDPMAEGVLVVLSGRAILEKNTYMGLDKTYETNVILGLTTDTGDLLGIPKISKNVLPTKTAIAQAIESLTGPQTLSLPQYSSPPLNGKPLWLLAKTGLLAKTSIPTKAMHFYEIKVLKTSTSSVAQVAKQAIKNVKLVSGDFRQDKITKSWEKLLTNEQKVMIISLEVHCASGSYIRSLGAELGKRTNTLGTLYSLKRTQVGDIHL